MATSSGEKIELVVLNRIFEMFTRISFVYVMYVTLNTFFDHQSFLIFAQIAAWIVAFCIACYYIQSSVRIFRTGRQVRKRYFREFSNKKAYIGYEVGSFWEVVDRYKDEEEVAIVLGVNNRLCLEDDYLSKTSLVYNYMQLLSEHDKEVTIQNIDKSMKGKIIEHDEEGRAVYEYGSLFVVHPTEEIHYEAALLSMCEPSSSNLTGKFSSTREALIESFEKLFEQMPSIFTNSTLIIPLIGTKSSGSPLSQEEVAKFLISAFADYSRMNQHRLARRLIISLYDQDFNEQKELMKIKQHIDMECEMGSFSYSKIKSEIGV